VRAGLTGDKVSAAAADLADEIGFDKVTISAVARGFGVTDASLYAHVTNLRDLRTRVACQAASDLADLLSSAIAGRSGVDALLAFADTYREFARSRPGRYSASQLPLDEAVLVASAGHQRLVATCYALMRGFDLAEPDLTDAVRMLRSTFHGFFTLEASGAFQAPREVTRSWTRIVQALGRTLSAWTSAT
jgi:AcrR family transcriptional regulator